MSVRVATTTNLAALSGLLTVDGITVVAGDLVLVKNQTTGTQNGVYVADSSSWSRSAILAVGVSAVGVVYMAKRVLYVRVIQRSLVQIR